MLNDNPTPDRPTASHPTEPLSPYPLIVRAYIKKTSFYTYLESIVIDKYTHESIVQNPKSFMESVPRFLNKRTDFLLLYIMDYSLDIEPFSGMCCDVSIRDAILTWCTLIQRMKG